MGLYHQHLARGALLRIFLAVALLAIFYLPTPVIAAEPVDRSRDTAAITQLTVNYALGTDAIGANDKAKGIALYQETFTADAVVMVEGDNASRRVGGPAWADYVESVFRSARYDRTQHLIGTIDVRFDPADANRAQMSSYLTSAHRVADGRSVLVVLGTYLDDVVRTDGQWRIAKRTLSVMSSWSEKPN